MVLKNHSDYHAHIHEHKQPELLYQHIKLVNSYALSLVKAHYLDTVIDRIILEYTAAWGENKDFAAAQLKRLFVHAIVFHDFGKVNPLFQELRMKNRLSVSGPTSSVLQPAHGHSFLGTFLFLCYHIQQLTEEPIPDREKLRIICHCFFLAYPILQHHSPMLADVIAEDGYMGRFKDMLEPLETFTRQYGLQLHKAILEGIFKHANQIWKGVQKAAGEQTSHSFPLFALLKLNFSLLTAADYLATHEYMSSPSGSQDAATTDFGIFDSPTRIQAIIGHLRGYQYNASTFLNMEHYSFLHPTEKSGAHLNRLRQEMAVEVIQTTRNNLSKQLFYIEAPTGGGKTNLSIIAVTELLEANKELNKVFYVFPFTTLITQTKSVLKSSLGLEDHEIIELHSKAGFQSKQSKTRQEQTEDGLYGDEKKDYIDHLFALYPVTLLSHIKFFDILKSNGKESNYLLHRLANSIVVIDEIQSYNPAIGDKMLYFINHYARLFNIRFILMSATLPKISQLEIGLTQKPDFIDLLPNARQYITNANFAERVSFNFNIYTDKTDLASLAASVMDKSKQYADFNGSVRTIVEFIYKKSASAFHQLINTPNALFDKIFVLSGTILEPRRREIINFIKRHAGEKINILLITTQVVEAGVDIDMDIGFKNISLIDSDEQLAGRVNRNACKQNCEVYLFKLDDARVLYGSDYRFKETSEQITPTQYKEILQTKDFRQLYEKVLSRIDKLNNLHLSDNLPNYEDGIRQLRFKNTDANFKIIDQETQSVFVPLRLPVYIEAAEGGKAEAVFSATDWQFLRSFNVHPVNDQLDGNEVWELFETIINNRSNEKTKKTGFDLNHKITFKTLQNIMSKFTFSLLAHSKDYQGIRTTFGEEKYGYLYFSYWNDDRENGKPYHYETGLNSNAFSDANFI